MNIEGRNAAMKILLAGNVFLFLLKLAAGLHSRSIAVLSDAFNSLTDIMASVVVVISMRVALRQPDQDHHYGHHRAEPIAGLVVAVLAFVLGVEVLRQSLMRLLGDPVQIDGLVAFWAMIITIAVKTIMGAVFFVVGRHSRSPALKAAFVDALNDVMIGLVVIAGIVGVRLGWPATDALAGLLVGLVVIYAGYRIGRENLDFLMGRAAAEHVSRDINQVALSVNGVKGVNDVLTHYVGNRIHAEVHIEVDPAMRTDQAHDIGKEVQFRIESIEDVSRVFIHIDPFKEK